ncbi:MAG: hypothetical protein KC501_02930 [Myxococcales bacterium]|nr:hypothetical protein [Myxococcales bacterium]
MMSPRSIPGALLALAFATAAVTCNAHEDEGGSGDTNGSPDQAGSVCMVPDDCYPDVDHGDLAGTVQCLERVSEGYCTHLCGSDADCCAAEGECVSDLPQVCSPFESTGMMMCFLSCEPEDVASTDAADEQAFCQHEVGPAFICRSSGGGSNNRKVCVPGDCGVGSSCAETADCPDDLECNTDYDGGYCGVTGCSANADCPGDSRCVQDGDASYCARPCAADSDCTFCRHPDHPATCTSDVAYAEAGTSGSVCVVG